MSEPTIEDVIERAMEKSLHGAVSLVCHVGPGDQQSYMVTWSSRDSVGKLVDGPVFTEPSLSALLQKIEEAK